MTLTKSPNHDFFQCSNRTIFEWTKDGRMTEVVKLNFHYPDQVLNQTKINFINKVFESFKTAEKKKATEETQQLDMFS